MAALALRTSLILVVGFHAVCRCTISGAQVDGEAHILGITMLVCVDIFTKAVNSNPQPPQPDTSATHNPLNPKQVYPTLTLHKFRIHAHTHTNLHNTPHAYFAPFSCQLCPLRSTDTRKATQSTDVQTNHHPFHPPATFPPTHFPHHPNHSLFQSLSRSTGTGFVRTTAPNFFSGFSRNQVSRSPSTGVGTQLSINDSGAAKATQGTRATS